MKKINTGRFRVWVYEDDRKTLIDFFTFQNAMTMQGLNAALNVELAGGPQINPWFMGLISNSPAPVLSVNDTMASHPGWAELTSYDEATREQLTFGPAAGGIIFTPDYAEFTINDTAAIKGAFIVSLGTKGGTTGTLRAHGLFGAVQNRTPGQFMRIDYEAQNTAG